MKKARLRARNLRAASADSGFTLLELIVVVLIIGILAAIALPVYAGVVRASYKASAQSWTTSASKAIYMYYLTNGVMPDTLTTAGAPPAPGSIRTQYYSGLNVNFRNPEYCVSAYWSGAPSTGIFGPTDDAWKVVFSPPSGRVSVVPKNPESYCVNSGG